MITLHPYQQPSYEALLNILTRRNSALDASDVGTGKSYVAAKVAETLGLRPFVICPKAVAPMWKDLLASVNVPRWGVGTWEMMRSKTLPFGHNLWILDEVQRAKGRDSLNSKLALNCAKHGKVLMLSATAASNPLEMKALGAILELYAPGRYWDWIREHGCKKGFFGGMVFKGGEEEMTRIHRAIFPHKGVRMRVSEIVDFPECDTQADVLDFGEPIAEMAAELQAVDAAALEDKDPDNPLTIQTRERQRTELLKVPTLVEMAEELVSEGRSVVIFGNFNSTLQAIHDRLQTPSDFFTGEHERTRDDAKNRFQADALRVLLVNIKAGGAGLSLHDLNGKFPRISLICPTFSVVDYRQALGRIHRSGAKSKAIQKILFSAGTVEERVAKLLRQKNFRMDLLNDADLINPPEENNSLTVEGNFPRVPSQTNTKMADAPLNQKPQPKLSPSGLKYVRLSPCFENDPGGDKTAADEGTAIHAACETGVIPATFTDEQKQVVQMCLDYVQPLVSRPGAQVFKELSFHELAEFSPLMRRGKADLVVLYSNTAELVDYKAGRNAVDDAAVNDQQKAYVVAMFQRWPHLKAVRVHLLMPRRDEVSTHTFSADDVPRLRADLASIIVTAERYHRENLTAPRTDTCLWCAKRHSCPAVVGTAMAIAKGYDAELQIPAEFHPSKVTDPKAMAVMLDAASVMDKWVQSARHHFTQAMLNGVDIPGYELREKKAARSVDDAMAAYAVVREVIDRDEFLAACSISLPALEKAWCEKAPRGQKGKAKEELISKLIEVGALKQGAPSHYLGRVKK